MDEEKPGADRDSKGVSHDGTRQERHEHRLGDLKFALVGGGIAAACMFIGVAVVGAVRSHEAQVLLESVRPSLQFLSSGSLAAGATIVALMLTLLGISFSMDVDFSGVHFERIKIISLLASIAMVLSVTVLLFLLLPVAEREGSTLYNSIVYYTLIAGGAALGGISTSVALMLHRTVVGIAKIGHPDTDPHASELLADLDRSDDKPTDKSTA